MIKTAIIRERNQLTIPEEIRKRLIWITPGTAVNILAVDNSLIIQPHVAFENTPWEKIISTMKKIAKAGKKISLSKFILKDRLSH
jgi:bifunctional DNA-binding transcriptional regulator/antitoxin component of YhaV-PrlF toxin-antitoxin module